MISKSFFHFVLYRCLSFYSLFCLKIWIIWIWTRIISRVSWSIRVVSISACRTWRWALERVWSSISSLLLSWFEIFMISVRRWRWSGTWRRAGARAWRCQWIKNSLFWCNQSLKFFNFIRAHTWTHNSCCCWNNSRLLSSLESCWLWIFCWWSN